MKWIKGYISEILNLVKRLTSAYLSSLQIMHFPESLSIDFSFNETRENPLIHGLKTCRRNKLLLVILQLIKTFMLCKIVSF